MASRHAYGQQQPPQLGATFVPGGFDDYYIPVTPPEVISPSPQRLMPEAPQQIQDGIARLELEGDGPGHRPLSNYATAGSQMGLYHQGAPSGQGAGYPPAQQPRANARQSYAQNVPTSSDTPNFSPFPKLHNASPNVPPSDDEKEAILWDARQPVLDSNDPEMQLAWAQDALAFVDAAMTNEARISESQPARPQTPQIEHQLRIDAMNIVSFLADQHHPKAEFMKGMWLEFGKFGQRQDKREAFRCYQRASERGYSRAEYRMGMQFESSNVPIKALQHYKKGAEEGDSASNYRLGMMTLLGQAGQQQDFAGGVRLLRQAAATADENAPQGAYVLGMLLANELHQVHVPETYLPYDERAARANIEKAAYLEFAKAQLKMGSAYELSALGCEFNPALSLHYNALASRQGEIEADMAISKWFLCGYEGVFQKNEELAFVYANRAALSGLPTAMFGVGYFYEIGLHVPQDSQKALEWYTKAAQAGNEDAEGRIRAINSSGQTLSKKDHENVALGRIRSQHGSRRGKRPDRLAAKAGVPGLPTVTDEHSYGNDEWGSQPNHLGRPATVALPPRSSSTAPYPANGQQFATPPVSRPATTAPYPTNDAPPRVGLAGGFAPEMRPQSVNVPGYGDQGLRPGPPGGWQQDRPHSAYETYGQQAAPRPGGQRVPSGPGGPQSGYRQSSMPNFQNHGDGGQQHQQPMIPPKEPIHQGANIGYSAPQDYRSHQQGHGGMQNVAPLNYQKRNQTPVGQQPPPRGDSRPSSGYVSPMTRQASSRPAASTPSSRHSSATAQPGVGSRPAGQKPANTPAAGGGRPAARPPGKGPKTFDDMGIPAKKQGDDCTVM